MHHVDHRFTTARASAGSTGARRTARSAAPRPARQRGLGLGTSLVWVVLAAHGRPAAGQQVPPPTPAVAPLRAFTVTYTTVDMGAVPGPVLELVAQSDGTAYLNDARDGRTQTRSADVHLAPSELTLLAELLVAPSFTRLPSTATGGEGHTTVIAVRSPTFTHTYSFYETLPRDAGPVSGELVRLRGLVAARVSQTTATPGGEACPSGIPEVVAPRCRAGTVCGMLPVDGITRGVCLAPGAENARCDATTPCGPGLACVTRGTTLGYCRHAGALGAPCGAPGDAACGAGLHCGYYPALGARICLR